MGLRQGDHALSVRQCAQVNSWMGLRKGDHALSKVRLAEVDEDVLQVPADWLPFIS